MIGWPLAHHVADDDHIGLKLGQLFGRVAFAQRNASFRQLGAHRRINAGVAAGDGMSAAREPAGRRRP